MTNFGLIGAAAIALLAATPAMAAQGRHHHRYAYARRAAPVRDPRQSWLDTVLIGLGDSDKPDIPYRVEDHARYLQTFIEALQLNDVMLILHDWGSALGLDWARRHSMRIRGLALMEFLPPMPTWLDLGSQAYEFFKAFRDPVLGRKLIID